MGDWSEHPAPSCPCCEEWVDKYYRQPPPDDHDLTTVMEEDPTFCVFEKDSKVCGTRASPSRWFSEEIEDRKKVNITMRLDRSKILDGSEGSFHGRLWLQVEGMPPQVIIENVKIGDKEIVYPMVYASRPKEDILREVRVSSYHPVWSNGALKPGMGLNDSIEGPDGTITYKDKAEQLPFGAEAAERLYKAISKEVDKAEKKGETHKKDLHLQYRRLLSHLWFVMGHAKDEHGERDDSITPPYFTDYSPKRTKESEELEAHAVVRFNHEFYNLLGKLSVPNQKELSKCVKLAAGHGHEDGHRRKAGILRSGRTEEYRGDIGEDSRPAGRGMFKKEAESKANVDLDWEALCENLDVDKKVVTRLLAAGERATKLKSGALNPRLSTMMPVTPR